MELQEVVTIGEMPLVSSVLQIREKIKALGERPDPSAVEGARKGLIEADAALARALESIVFEQVPAGEDVFKWSQSQAAKENAARDAAERQKLPLRAILQMDELHQLYANMLKEAESMLENKSPLEDDKQQQQEQHNPAVSRALDEAVEKQSTELSLTNQLLQQVPESIGRITSITTLNLSVNHIEVLPDAIAGLVNLLRLDVHSNRLRILPDSVGLLSKLQYLDVSSNQLRTLPESINGCSSLIELSADFNKLEYLPSSFGRGLNSLELLTLHLNSLTSLPASICEAKSLKHLDVHFNKLRSLPKAIGNLTNLETLDASSNFNDLVCLPESMGDLTALTHLDLSYNQIRELPLSLGRLSGSIRSIKVDENPLVDPPVELVQQQQGVEGIMKVLVDRWEASLRRQEEEATAAAEVQKRNEESWIGGWITGVYSNVSSYLSSPKSSTSRDDYLEQQL